MVDLSPEILKPPMNVSLVTDEAGLDKVSDFFSRVTEFGFDVETNIVRTFFHRRIRTIQVGDRDEQYVIDLLAFAGTQDALVAGQGRYTPGDWARPVLEALRPALDGDKHVKVGHNLQFDYETTKWCLGICAWNLHDTLLMEKILHAGSVPFYQDGFWALDDVVGRYFNLRIRKDLQKSFDLETPLTEDQIFYCGLDTRLPVALKAKQLVQLEKAGLLKVAKLENDAIPAFGDMHLNGMYIDREAWTQAVGDDKRRHAEHIKTLDTFFLPVVGGKERPNVDVDAIERQWKDEPDRDKRATLRQEFYAARRSVAAWEKALPTYEGEAAINYSSVDQLLKALRAMGFNEKTLPDTNDKTMSKIAANYPVIRAIQAYRGTQKLLDSYGVAFIEKYLDPDTGRAHPNISQIGAETGRTSASAFNSQNLPEERRHCVRCRSGYKFASVDMAGAELRILAEESGEPVFVNAFAAGLDAHSNGAELMFQQRWHDARASEDCAHFTKRKKCKCLGHLDLRDKVKAINFGVAYGMEEQTLADRLGIDRMEARGLLQSWRRGHAVANNYLQESGKKAAFDLQARTLSGRRRLFNKPDYKRAEYIASERCRKAGRPVRPEDVRRAYAGMFGSIEREGKNTPIQGLNADIAKLCMGCGFAPDGTPYLWHRLRQYDAMLVNFVHDELDLEIAEGQAEEVVENVGECIVKAAAEFMKKVKMDYESKIGDRWLK